MDDQAVSQVVKPGTRIRRPGKFAVGTLCPTQSSGMCEVTEHLGKNKVMVRFVNTGTVTTCRTDHLGKGLVSDKAKVPTSVSNKQAYDVAAKAAVAKLFQKTEEPPVVQSVVQPVAVVVPVAAQAVTPATESPLPVPRRTGFERKVASKPTATLDDYVFAWFAGHTGENFSLNKDHVTSEYAKGAATGDAALYLRELSASRWSPAVVAALRAEREASKKARQAVPSNVGRVVQPAEQAKTEAEQRAERLAEENW